MEDYPRTLAEVEARFSSEQACRDYLFRLRWPDGFRCPRCSGTKAWPLGSVWWRCGRCRRQVSVTAGTIFQDTHTPLTVWFRAMWWVTAQKNGVSALGLQRVLGLGSYQAAWAWLHKPRRAMVRPGRDRLAGAVEVDETYLGGLEEGKRGRQTGTKALIVVASQEEYRARPDAVHPRRVGKELDARLCATPSNRAASSTHGWLGYEPFERNGYCHRITFLRGQAKSPSDLLPRVHRVISLLKPWLLGYPSGICQLGASGLLPGRVHVPVQP